MGLCGINEHEILDYAAKNVPILLIDCSNCANPHKLYPKFGYKELNSIYVIPVELIYSFRDVLKKIPEIMESLEINNLAVSSFSHLINYQDEEENNSIYEHAWDLLRELSKKYNIVISEYGTHCMEPKNSSRDFVK
jgi:hypothetical protein